MGIFFGLIKKLYATEIKALVDSEVERIGLERSREIVMVAQFTESWSRTNRMSGEKVDQYKVIYSLYEDEHGERTIDINSTAEHGLANEVERSDTYASKIVPWLKGAYIKDIDSYDEARQQQMVDKLAK